MSPRCADNRAPMRVLWASAALLLSACAATPPAQEQAPAEGPPPDPPAAVEQFDRAITLLGAGDLDLAVRELRSLSAEYPQYSGPPANLGIAHLKAGRLTEAEEALRQAVERNPQNAVAFNHLGIVYRKLGRFAEADAAYQRAVTIDPDYALAHLNLGILCDLYLRQPERALAQYERYVALTGAEPRVNGWIAELRSRLGSTARAARAEQ